MQIGVQGFTSIKYISKWAFYTILIYGMKLFSTTPSIFKKYFLSLVNTKHKNWQSAVRVLL